MEKGGQMADELNELYAYCEKTVKEYLETKNLNKLKEIGNYKRNAIAGPNRLIVNELKLFPGIKDQL